MDKRNLSHPINSTESEGIAERLDTIISLLIPPNRHSENGGKTLQNLILDLCDYDHTTEEIMEATRKSASHVNKELSLLRSKGLVKSVRRGQRQVHVRLPAKNQVRKSAQEPVK